MGVDAFLPIVVEESFPFLEVASLQRNVEFVQEVEV